MSTAVRPRERLTVTLEAYELSAGMVVVQSMRVGMPVLQDVLGVELEARGGVDWVVVKARDRVSALRLFYPPFWPVTVERESVDPDHLPLPTPPPSLPPARRTAGEYLTVRPHRGASLHLMERAATELTDDGVYAQGRVECGRWVTGRIIAAGESDMSVCRFCARALDVALEAADG